MDVKTIQLKTNAELDALLRDLHKKLQDLRVSLAQNKTTDLKQYRETRKDIARVNTILRARELKPAAQTTEQH